MARVKVLEEYSEEIEELRKEHRPNDIEALFVAESPPPQGKGGIKFFYSPEAPNRLREFMRETFEKLQFHSENFSSDREFLKWFEGRGFYLTDLIKVPIEKTEEGDTTVRRLIKKKGHVWKGSKGKLKATVRRYCSCSVARFLKIC